MYWLHWVIGQLCGLCFYIINIGSWAGPSHHPPHLWSSGPHEGAGPEDPIYKIPMTQDNNVINISNHCSLLINKLLNICQINLTLTFLMFSWFLSMSVALTCSIESIVRLWSSIESIVRLWSRYPASHFLFWSPRKLPNSFEKCQYYSPSLQLQTCKSLVVSRCLFSLSGERRQFSIIWSWHMSLKLTNFSLKI